MASDRVQLRFEGASQGPAGAPAQALHPASAASSARPGARQAERPMVCHRQKANHSLKTSLLKCFIENDGCRDCGIQRLDAPPVRNSQDSLAEASFLRAEAASFVADQ